MKNTLQPHIYVHWPCHSFDSTYDIFKFKHWIYFLTTQWYLLGEMNIGAFYFRRDAFGSNQCGCQGCDISLDWISYALENLYTYILRHNSNTFYFETTTGFVVGITTFATCGHVIHTHSKLRRLYSHFKKFRKLLVSWHEPCLAWPDQFMRQPLTDVPVGAYINCARLIKGIPRVEFSDVKIVETISELSYWCIKLSAVFISV